MLLVDLSEQYGALADVSLTLADYSIVLTLSQLEGVEGVEITAGGHRVSYRSHPREGRQAFLRSGTGQQGGEQLLGAGVFQGTGLGHQGGGRAGGYRFLGRGRSLAQLSAGHAVTGGARPEN